MLGEGISMKGRVMLKYVNTDVVFQEIPDEVTLAINISNCPCHCPGCHSRYLWEDIGLSLDTEAIDAFITKYGKSITCLAFMGGDSDPKAINLLAQYIHEKYPDYIKIGPYIRHLGPLGNPTTNQRMYRQNDTGTFDDITERFWRK